MLNLLPPDIDEKQDEFLIWLYIFIEEVYNKLLFLSCERFSNNSVPIFTDVELLTAFLFGQILGFDTQKKNYKYIKKHYLEWFQKLPSYPCWNKRLRLILDTFPYLIEYVIQNLFNYGHHLKNYDLVDSAPIKIARGSRSYKAKTASEIANRSYCESQDEWYYGVKLHMQATAKYGTLPFLKLYSVTPASTHDLTAWKPMLFMQENQIIYGDKAYIDHELEEHLCKWNNVLLITPHKRKKGQKHLPLFKQVDNTNHSKKRQTIDALFSWVQEKTNIQRASKVRSMSGLFLHVYSKIAAAMIIMFVSIFNC